MCACVWLNIITSIASPFLLHEKVDLRDFDYAYCIYVNLGTEGVLAPIFLLQDDNL
jgi:hypothetical protein